MDDFEREEQEKLAEKVAARKEELVLAYKKIFSGPEGEMVLHHLIQNFHVYKTTLRSDPMETAFNEGQRMVVTHILSQVDINLDRLRKFIEEAKNAQTNSYR